MSWPASVVVDTVFIPIYVLLLLTSFINVLNNGFGKAGGFIFLVVFSIFRLIGNILLVIAFKQNYDSKDVLEWGYICQGLGYSFLLNATLAFCQRAKDPNAVHQPGVKKGLLDPSPINILQLISTTGLILLIIGYLDSDGIFTSNPSTTSDAILDVKAKIGNCLFLGDTVAITALVLFIMKTRNEVEARTICKFILLALPFMFPRIIYVTYQSFSAHFLSSTLWVKVVFEYCAEVIVVLVFFVMGVIVRKQQEENKAPFGQSSMYDSRPVYGQSTIYR